MADEATGPDGISKSGNTPGAVPTPGNAAPEPEVHILEERVTRVAQKQTAPVSEASAPAKPEVPPAAPIKPPVIPPPTPTPAAPAPVAPAPAPTIDALRGQSKPPVKQEAPVAPKADLTSPTVGNDIAKILESVKLPERRPPVQTGAPAPKPVDAVGAGAPPAQKPASADQVPPMVVPKKVGDGPDGVRAVHTLKQDLQNVVRDSKISLVRAASLEEDRRARKEAVPQETPGTKQRSRRTMGIIFAVCILIALGIAALFGISYVMKQQQSPQQADGGSSLLFAEQSIPLPLADKSAGDLKRALEAARTVSQRTLGSIIRIVPVVVTTLEEGTTQTRPSTFREFMLAMGAHPPDDLLRALGDDFFLGVHAVDENAPLIIVPVTAYDHAFSAMLRWEDDINTDLAPFFSTVPVLAADKDGLPVKRTYADLVMRNYDTRVLRDDSGTIQLYYSFPTPNILVIAESPYSFPEILSRLQASRKL